MDRISTLVASMLLMSLIVASPLHAQQATPFKLGTFARQGQDFIGIVLDDSTVIDFAAANSALSQGRIDPPADMKQLISRYDDGVRNRIVQIVDAVRGARTRLAYVHALSSLKVRPPIMYPTTMMNTALNYTEHALEMEDVRDAGGDGSTPPGIAGPDVTRPPGLWEPDANDRRWNPYMFLKAPAAVIAHGEQVRLPPRRTEIDWECELGIVIGQEALHVPVTRARDFIFGYTIELDVSDRGSRGDSRYGSDWLAGKSHDTFAPMGPFITPKEFVSDPTDLDILFKLNGETMQDSTTSLMIHDVYEQVAYASNILTLRPGDVIATGTPSGVGSGRNPPIYLQDGDRTSCTYEGIGTLENTVVRP